MKRDEIKEKPSGRIQTTQRETILGAKRVCPTEEIEGRARTA